MTTIHVTVRRGRRTNEVFTSTTLDNEAAFSAIVAALQAKGFTVETHRYELINSVSLRVTGLRSDRASDYATDIVFRAGHKAGFSFLSTEHR